MSCETLLLKLLAWVTKHSQANGEAKRLDRWKRQHADLIERVQRHQQEFSGEEGGEKEEEIITDEIPEAVDGRPRKDYNREYTPAATELTLSPCPVFCN